MYTSVCCKPTLSGVYTNFESVLPSAYKFGTVYILANIRFGYAQAGLNYN